MKQFFNNHIFCVLCYTLLISPLSATFREEALDKFKPPKFKQAASDESESFLHVASNYGNKTANLCILHGLAGKIARFEVPAFFAISSDDIKKHLQNSFDFDKSWNDFTTKQNPNKKSLTSKAIEHLTNLRSNINKAFEQKIPTELGKKIFENLSLTAFKDKFLMVRSTGREDSKELANAGGNESISSVPATVEAVWQAMGMVVKSYFSEKSISQRLISGDDITKDPFMPVLVQVMIGETPTIIPISGVMFSQEAEGNTPGIAQIHVAYGHNEGVVNSLVAVDTFYVSEKKGFGVE